jgi:hypothetical protein
MAETSGGSWITFDGAAVRSDATALLGVEKRVF